MSQRFNLHQTFKLEQRFTMNMSMRHAFDALQMPICELSAWVRSEIEKNPLLLISSPERHRPSYIEETAVKKQTRNDFLEKEIREHFNTDIEIKIAQFIGNSLTDKGFMLCSVDEISSSLKITKSKINDVLYRFQRMEVAGLGTKTAKEALLVQLEVKGKKSSLIYHIVEKHYDDLLKKSHIKISKYFRISTSELQSLIDNDLKPLNPFPGYIFINEHNPPITPDIILKKFDNQWKVEIAEWEIPVFHVNYEYLQILSDNKEKEFIREFITKGQRLYSILNHRRENLKKIIEYILVKQGQFLEGLPTDLKPMNMREIAQELGKSESTISRSVANKYIYCPLGTIKLRSLFTQALKTEQGSISNKQAKDLIIKLVNKEKKPLSDESLSKLLKHQGIPCSRRTVAKYRKELKILPSTRR